MKNMSHMTNLHIDRLNKINDLLLEVGPYNVLDYIFNNFYADFDDFIVTKTNFIDKDEALDLYSENYESF